MAHISLYYVGCSADWLTTSRALYPDESATANPALPSPPPLRAYPLTPSMATAIPRGDPAMPRDAPFRSLARVYRLSDGDLTLVGANGIPRARERAK